MSNPSSYGTRSRYLMAGILTIIPLWVTYLVFSFLFRELSSLGLPWVRTLAGNMRDDAPFLQRLLLQEWFQSVLAVVIIIALLYALGWAATRVVGREVIGLVDRIMHSIPFIQNVYGGTKKVVGAFELNASSVQRVVLIEFPAPGMQALGFLTRVVHDTDTGQELAVVCIPTAPNPSSGFLEILPMKKVKGTDMTFEEAIAAIVSAGLTCPETLPFTRVAAQGGQGRGDERASSDEHTSALRP